jgi:hypothetical protein
MDDKLGSLEKGKHPGVILLEPNLRNVIRLL